MGVDDLMAAKNMVMTALQTTELKRIDYQTFNSLQKVENTTTEARYNALLQRVGTTVSFDADLVSYLVSYLVPTLLSVFLGTHQSPICNYCCLLSPHCVLIFPVLDKQKLEVISSWVHLAALLRSL